MGLVSNCCVILTSVHLGVHARIENSTFRYGPSCVRLLGHWLDHVYSHVS